MRVLDLFSGLGGWSAPFAQRGHEAVTLDLDPRFQCNVTADILTVTVDDLLQWGPFDGVLASPPCEAFSVASIGKHWESSGVPKTDAARLGARIVAHTLDLITGLGLRQRRAPWWLLENPRGMLRKLPVVSLYPRVTVTFCQYGERRMKPTDLWGHPPVGWVPRPACVNGSPCHDAAPRGAKTGTQGIKGAAKRAEIPAELALSVCRAAESPDTALRPLDLAL